ncbi:MAG: hypothetical protein M3Q96_01625 [Pseudomonadota bacterium]|nr:hypothetical protein [Pseudomonadota bacterium]MDQ3229619.1 hypothetical protein [Pseudomonadota bacterium]
MTFNGMTFNGMTSKGLEWDTLQREVLEALGHVLYVPVHESAMRVEEETADAYSSGPNLQDRNVSRARAVERGMPSRTQAAPDALMQALLRAANLDKDDVATLQLRLPPLDALTANADAKRKLWPTLRAMRAQRRT